MSAEQRGAEAATGPSDDATTGGSGARSRPTFVPGTPLDPSAPALGRPVAPRPGAAPTRTTDPAAVLLRPPPSRWPALLTVLVLTVVGSVVAGATAVARHADTHVAAAPPPRVRPLVAEPQDGGVVFTTGLGAGRLRLVRHSWERTGTPAPRSGRYLRVQVELVCTSGRVDYDSDYFSVFDAQGQLVPATRVAAGATAVEGLAGSSSPLPPGTLEAGERVRGLLSFDLPRGSATLVMEDGTHAVTAVKVPN